MDLILHTQNVHDKEKKTGKYIYKTFKVSEILKDKIHLPSILAAYRISKFKK